jgi:GNAT superfamily N-acetyltransferase
MPMRGIVSTAPRRSEARANIFTIMKNHVTTFHLEMTSQDELRPSAGVPGLEVRRAAAPCPELNSFFYSAVGGRWSWVDRLQWSEQQWLEYLDRPELETWLGYVSGTPAGYFELELQNEANVEIVYFGLLPSFVGKGYGGALLTTAVKRAWEMRASRVWVHTCSLDHPAALANYQARGFSIFKEESEESGT